MSPHHSFLYFCIDLLLFALVLYPIIRIVAKAGYSPWWCLLLFAPVIGWIAGLWLLALGDWPALPPSGEEQT